MNQYQRAFLEMMKLESRGIDVYSGRRELVAKYSWAIPNNNAIWLVASLSPLIEIGADNGYWASLVHKAGGWIKAFDRDPGGHITESGRKLWFPVRAGGPESLPDDCSGIRLFLCWPPYDDSMAAEALRIFIANGGRRLVYVGERFGGCTADDAFFNILTNKFKQTGSVDIPSWPGLHDELLVFSRK